MSQFLDVNSLKPEDWDEIKHNMSALSITLQEAIGKFMNENPGKIKVLGEFKNGKIIRDEIDANGVHEYTGKEALNRIFDETVKNREKREDE